MDQTWSVILVTLVLMIPGGYSVGGGNSCAEVRRAFATRNIGPMKMVPQRAINSKNLQICSNSKPTCCTRKMERKYKQSTNEDLVQLLDEKISGFKFHLIKFSQEFEADLINLIRNSKSTVFTRLNSSFHEIIDVSSLKKIIDALFSDIIIARDDVTIGEVVTQLHHSVLKFFESLFALTFQQETFISLSENQFKCVASQSSILDYYNVHTNLLLDHLIYSLNQTSIVVQALDSGIKVVSLSAQAYVNEECQKALVKMQYCGHCYGLTLIKPCKNHCLNVMRGCLVGISETDTHWQRYVARLAATVKNMTKHKTDLESVLAEIDTQLQSTSKRKIPENAINEVKGTCQLSSARYKRSPSKLPSQGKLKHRLQQRQKRRRRNHLGLNAKSATENFKSKRILPPPHQMLISEPHLPVKVEKKKEEVGKKTEKEVIEKQRIFSFETKDANLNSKLKRFTILLNYSSNFFSNLPDDFCDSDDDHFLAVAPRRSCWDGKQILNKYSRPTPDKGLPGQYDNPDVNVTGIDPVVKQNINELHVGFKDAFFSPGDKSNIKIFDNFSPPTKTSKLQPEDEEDNSKEGASLPCTDDEDDCGEVGSTGSGDNVRRSKEELSGKSRHIKKQETSNSVGGKATSRKPSQNSPQRNKPQSNISESISKDLEEIMNAPPVGAAEPNKRFPPVSAIEQNHKSNNKGGWNSAKGFHFRESSWRTFVAELTLLYMLRRILF